MQAEDEMAWTYMLYELTHAGLRNATATKDLHCVARSILCATRGVHLQETNGTMERNELML